MTPTLLAPGPQPAAATTPSAATPAAPPRRKGHAVAPTTDHRHWVDKPSGRPDPAGHLTTEQIDALGKQLDALRDEVMSTRGAADARYIRTVITTQRYLELASRLILLGSNNPAAWIAGTAGLSLAKILENMEIGHNVLHGQWDWMRDPKIHSTSWEWDHVGPSSLWKKSHNETHHTYTNVLGKDDDLGYGILRVDEDQPWEPKHLSQPFTNLLNMVFFEFGIAFYDLHLGTDLKRRPEMTPEERAAFDADLKLTAKKMARQVARDYVLHPLLSGPSAPQTLLANIVANLVRNVWSNWIIVCGHFPDGVETFETESIDGESRGEWYLRQMLGSANISGSPVIHLMSGNLSHQIEHHMYPDMPSNRYAQIAPRVRQIMADHGLTYVTGPFLKQLWSVQRKVIVLSLPNGAWDELKARPIPTLRKGAAWLRAHRRERRAAKAAAKVAPATPTAAA